MASPSKPRSQTTAAAAKAPPGRRTAYVVLGMHRSGTSAVTKLLGLAGAQLPAHVMPGDEHNAKGYFEPWRIALLNDERLRAAGSAWDDVFAFPFRPLPEPEETAWRSRAETLFADEFRGVRIPLLKDPRVTVLMPFWRTVFAPLQIDARCVIPVRHPLAVAESLARRDGFPAEKSVLLWAAYMLAAEAYTRDLPRAFVDYDGLLADWRTEVARLEAAHGAPLPRLTQAAGRAIDRFLSPELRHNAGHGDLEMLGWAGKLAADAFDWFHAAATGQAPGVGGLDAAGAALAERRREMGALVSPMTRDLDATRTELREARARLDLEAAERQRLEGEVATFHRTVEKVQAELEAAIREP